MDQNNQNNQSAPSGATPDSIDGKVQLFIERFKELPKNTQYIIIGVFAFFALMLLTRGGDEKPRAVAQKAATSSAIKVGDINQNAGKDKEENLFGASDPSRESLMSGFVGQQQLALTELRNEMQKRLTDKEDELDTVQVAITEQTRQMQQMITNFNTQMRNMEESNASYREEIARLAEEARKQGSQKRQVQDAYVSQKRRSRIAQTPLASGGAGVNVGSEHALLNVKGTGRINANQGDINAFIIPEEPRPFIPPLGFIKATLLNGVDALAGGGQAAPALARLHGIYKTAMNSTVNLDGCFVLIEFEGDVSVERAMGKPSRMTCVYPDQGATTYSLTGYVVDAEDGIIGVPGIFYEGDASRIAAALLADFSAGIAATIEENQKTTTVSPEGVVTTTLTGDQVKAEMSGGITSMAESLSGYLHERINRVVPFIRIDATRNIHMVLLSGTELRHEGSAWSLLFDAEKADQAKKKQEQARQQQANQRQQQ